MGGMAVKERDVAESAGPARVVGLPRPRGADGWTAAELDDFPDDGLRYELIDGMLLVSPAPSRGHQRCSFRLGGLLDSAATGHQEVLSAPLDWRPGDGLSFQPDLLVIPSGPSSEAVADPVLLVEIVSPSSVTADRVVKSDAYAEAGVPQYWIVEPGAADDGSDAVVEVYDLVDGAYVEQGRARGSEALDVEGPIAVRVVPAELVK